MLCMTFFLNINVIGLIWDFLRPFFLSHTMKIKKCHFWRGKEEQSLKHALDFLLRNFVIKPRLSWETFMAGNQKYIQPFNCIEPTALLTTNRLGPAANFIWLSLPKNFSPAKLLPASISRLLPGVASSCHEVASCLASGSDSELGVAGKIMLEQN